MTFPPSVIGSPGDLIIEGARQHNLKNISLRIPHNAVTAITGVSGSGKSSLAFDTLFAEGQWRYVESLSTYARMFLERLDRLADWEQTQLLSSLQRVAAMMNAERLEVAPVLDPQALPQTGTRADVL